MAALRSGSGSLEEVTAALRSAEVYLPRLDVETGAEELQLPLVTTPDGEQYVAVFPSLSRLEAATEPGTPFARLSFEALLSGWPADAGVVVDPGGDLECALSFEQLSGQPQEERIEAGTRVFVGEPAEEPVRALGALVDILSAREEVIAAYRAQVYVEDQDEGPHVAVGLLVEPGAHTGELLTAASAAADAGDGDLRLLVLEAEDPGNPVGSFMLAETEPFYRRGG